MKTFPLVTTAPKGLAGVMARALNFQRAAAAFLPGDLGGRVEQIEGKFEQSARRIAAWHPDGAAAVRLAAARLCHIHVRRAADPKASGRETRTTQTLSNAVNPAKASGATVAMSTLASGPESRLDRDGPRRSRQIA